MCGVYVWCVCMAVCVYGGVCVVCVCGMCVVWCVYVMCNVCCVCVVWCVCDVCVVWCVCAVVCVCDVWYVCVSGREVCESPWVWRNSRRNVGGGGELFSQSEGSICEDCLEFVCICFPELAAHRGFPP